MGTVGYTFIIDTIYPRSLHRLHANYPFFPQKRCLDPAEISEYTQELLRNLNYSTSGHAWQQQERLISDFTPKKVY